MGEMKPLADIIASVLTEVVETSADEQEEEDD